MIGGYSITYANFFANVHPCTCRALQGAAKVHMYKFSAYRDHAMYDVPKRTIPVVKLI
jgi:hypothetical protein